jgi:hypothetical protein
MKAILKLEEVTMAIGALYLLSFYSLGLPIWLWCILFFVPDVSMIGYGINARWGALLYNLSHHKGIAIIIVLIGYSLSSEVLLATGLLLFSHASFDRIFGYGLKYKTGFNNTHLGTLQQQPKGFRVL